MWIMTKVFALNKAVCFYIILVGLFSAEVNLTIRFSNCWQLKYFIIIILNR